MGKTKQALGPVTATCGKLTVSMAGRSIDFWKAEYVKRRIFIDNKDSYGEILMAIRGLQETAKGRCLLMESQYSEEGVEELEILKEIEAGKNVHDILTADLMAVIPSDDDIYKRIQQAFSLSSKYGYVISQMALDYRETTGTCDVHTTRHFLQLLDHGVLATQKGMDAYAKDQWDHFVSDKSRHINLNEIREITSCIKKTCPLSFGKNTYHWHGVHIKREDTASDSLLSRAQNGPCDIDIHINSSRKDFSIDAALGEIEFELRMNEIFRCIQNKYSLLEQAYLIVSKQNNIPNKTKDIFCRDSFAKMLKEHKQKLYFIYTALDAEREFFEDQIYPNIINIEEKKTIETLCKKSDKLTKSIFKRLKKIDNVSKNTESGPVRGEDTEIARAVGLFLWDAVNVLGYTRSGAIKFLFDFIDKDDVVLSGIRKNLADEDKKDNQRRTLNRYYATTQRCIEEGSFLPFI